MGYIPLKQLVLGQQNAKIKVRIGRIWESRTPSLKNNILSLDFLMIDEEGYTMEATIRKFDVDTFKALVSEGNIYIIENFNIIPSRNNYKVVDRKFMIQISKWTRIVEAKQDDAAIPFYSFYFYNFDYIKSKRHAEGSLIDVLGNVIAIAPISYTYVGQHQAAIRKLQIGNLENQILHVTLWDKFAVDYEDQQILQEEKKGPVVVVFSAMSIRRYRDQIYISTCSASRLYTNLEIPEVTDFRTHLSRVQSPIPKIQTIESMTEPVLSPYEQMEKNRKHISELLMLNASENQNIKYTCQAKLVNIDTTYGWWYRACYDCKGAVKDYEDSFWCTQCGKNDQAPTPWYKLNAIVEDETGSANFTIFGRIAQDLIHVPAYQLATAANSDRFILPGVVANLIGQTYIFQISVDSRQINIGVQSFRVTKIFPLHLNIEQTDQELSNSARTNSTILTSNRSHSHTQDEENTSQPLDSQSSQESFSRKKRKTISGCTEDSAARKETII